MTHLRTLLILIASGLMAACSGTAPNYAANGHFAVPDCPPSPNCVSSRASNPDQRVDALFPRPSEAELRQLLQTLPRSMVLHHGPDYIHVTTRSLVFRFVDDVLLWPGNADTLEIRSASRVGYSDLGVNRQRVEDLHAAWERMRRQDAPN